MTALRLLVPLSFALLSACAQQPTQPVALDAESECPTRLQVGQTLTLTLPSNPSTGYRWRVEDPAANVLQSPGPEVYNAPEEEDVVGSAGVSTALPKPTASAPPSWCWFTNNHGLQMSPRCRSSNAKSSSVEGNQLRSYAI